MSHQSEPRAGWRLPRPRIMKVLYRRGVWSGEGISGCAWLLHKRGLRGIPPGQNTKKRKARRAAHLQFRTHTTKYVDISVLNGMGAPPLSPPASHRTWMRDSTTGRAARKGGGGGVEAGQVGLLHSGICLMEVVQLRLPHVCSRVSVSHHENKAATSGPC